MSSDYPNIEKLSWDQVLRGKPDQHQPPYTVHFPINPVGSPDFVHLDAALNVCRRRVFPGLSIREWDKYMEVGTRETLIVQFAFDDPPIVPDFHHTRLSTIKGEYPIAHASYWAYDICYQLEYMVMPIGDTQQNILIVRCKVTNEAPEEREVVVRTKVNFQKESDLFPYHYTPFSWDASNWLPCDRVGMTDQEITLDGNVIGRLIKCGLNAEWEESSEIDDSAYNAKFNGGSPQFIFPAFRLKNTDNLIRLSGKLTPGETRSFTLALFVDYENVDDYQLHLLRRISPDSARRDVMYHFRSQLPKPSTKLTFPAAEWDSISEAVQTSTLQLLVKFPDNHSLMPTQGGSSERHLVWVWEAVCMLMPMLKLGYFGPVKQALEFIFSLQDGGYPPEGKFTSLDGAIGTTGPRWANSTGSALALASDFYIHSKDDYFLLEYLPKMLRAADWIIREIRATRILQPDGSRPLTYGLLPYACSTDGDTGFIIAFSDAYTYWGLNKFAYLLEALGHERASEVRDEVTQYCLDISTAAAGVTREDGFIDRLIPQPGDIVELKFNNLVGAVHMAFAGCLDVHSEAFAKYMDYFDANMADGLFLGIMDREVVYTGISEWVWQDVYMRLGQWKKAFAAVRQNLLYGMTRDTHQVQERFSKFNPTFTPWQPNGSGNGKVLDTIIKSIYFELEDRAIILGGVPFAYIVDNQTTELKNLRTARGLISIKIIPEQNNSFLLSLSSTGTLPALVQFPNQFTVEPCGLIERTSTNLYSISRYNKVQFVLKEGAR